MKKLFLPYLTLLIFFTLLACAIFRVGWPSDEVFSGSDANIGLLTASHRLLPEYFSGAATASPVLGNVASVPMSVANVGKWLLAPAVYSDMWYGFYLILSSMVFIAYLRLWKLSWISCVLGALSAFWVGSITISASGHLAKLGVMMLFTLGLFLSEKTVRSTKFWSRLSFAVALGLVVALMLLEQQDVGLLAGLFLGPYLLFRLWKTQHLRWKNWLTILLPVALLGGGIAAPTALNSYATNVVQAGIQSDSQEKWNFITQWSMVPDEFPDLIAPGYMGWKTGDAKGPYWGKIGQSPNWEGSHQGFRNFRLDNSYIGIIPLFLAVWSLFWFLKNRKNNEGQVGLFWWSAATVALVLALGKYSFFYKLFYHLPLVGNIRAPIKFLHNFQVIVGVLSAFGMNALLFSVPKKEVKKGRGPWVAAAGLSLFLALIALGIHGGSVSEELSKWGNYAPTITKNMVRAFWHATGLCALLSVVLWSARKWPSYSTWLAILLPFAVLGDSIFLTNHYFKSVNILNLRKGNILIDYLKEHQGDERIYFIDQGGVYNGWLAMDVPYHGLNVFNIWQMPRMPQDYKNFLRAGQKNPVRLWQLASVKYLTAPARVSKQLPMMDPVMFYRFVRAGDGVGVESLMQATREQDQVLLKFNETLPRISLFHHWEAMPADQQIDRLFSPLFNPLKTVLVGGKVASPPSISAAASDEQVRATIGENEVIVQTESTGNGILLFTQHYQDGWNVLVDGVPTTLLRCNYLCLGVEVPSGRHTVKFICH